MTPVELLRELRSLLSDESRWAQRNFAYRANGVPTGGTYPEAVCWCVSGAMQKVLGNGTRFTTEAGYSLQAQVVSLLGEESMKGVVKFNDTHTHGEVMDWFDRALAKAEE